MVQEFKKFGDVGEQLRVRVGVLDSESDLRVSFDQGRSELFKVLQSVRIVLELRIFERNLGCLLEEDQVLRKVKLTEGLGGVAGDGGKRLDGRELGVLLALLVPEHIEHVRHQR